VGLRCVVLRCVALRCVVLRCIALQGAHVRVRLRLVVGEGVLWYAYGAVCVVV
jgi:hypothetical protein